MICNSLTYPILWPVSLFLCVVVLLSGCKQQTEPARLSRADSTAIVLENNEYRAARAEFFRLDPQSPFNLDSAASLGEFSWFPIDPGFRGTSKLHRYDNPAEVTIAGTGGELRRHIRYGYFDFAVPDSTGKAVSIRLNVYKNPPNKTTRDVQSPTALTVWFTDRTTGIETYGVGRYVDVEDEQSDTDHVYTIDLNMAYNPFCAYSDVYSCAIPSKEDHVPVFIRAGERIYHE